MLNVLQRKCARFSLDLGPRSHIGVNEFETLSWLPFPRRIAYSNLIHAFFWMTLPKLVMFIRTVSDNRTQIFPLLFVSVLLALLYGMRYLSGIRYRLN